MQQMVLVTLVKNKVPEEAGGNVIISAWANMLTHTFYLVALSYRQAGTAIWIRQQATVNRTVTVVRRGKNGSPPFPLFTHRRQTGKNS